MSLSFIRTLALRRFSSRSPLKWMIRDPNLETGDMILGSVFELNNIYRVFK